MDLDGMNLRAGDWVEVKSAEEIAETLDADGTLDNLPFMPEMIEFCGKRFRILRQARKACVECLTPNSKSIDMREFLGTTVWVTEGLRCTGTAHDGCQRGCLLFWKAAWLRKLETDQPPLHRGNTDSEALRRRLKNKAEMGKYFCQSTELVKTTKPLSLKARLRICFDDVRFADVGLFEMIKLLVLPLFWKTVHKFVVPRHVAGPLIRTQLMTIGLKSGETVEVKMQREIAQTLNDKGCNRGLRYDRGLNQFCGTRYRVRDRLDRMIIESTGQMVKLEGTVTLEGSNCTCYMTAFGGCSRQDLVYWREAWLNRVSVGGATDLASRRASPNGDK